MDLRKLPPQPEGTVQVVFDEDYQKHRVIEWATAPTEIEVRARGFFRHASARKKMFFGLVATSTPKPYSRAALLDGIPHENVVIATSQFGEYSEAMFDSDTAYRIAVMVSDILKKRTREWKERQQQVQQQVQRSVIATFSPDED